MFWDMQDIFFLFGYKALRAIVTLFCSSFFESSFLDGNFIHFQIYLFIKSLIFVILCGSFFIFIWFITTGTVFWKNLLSFDLLLLFCFLLSHESLYIFHHDWDLFYDIYNIITKHSWRQTHYFSAILSCFDIFSRSSFIISSAL